MTFRKKKLAVLLSLLLIFLINVPVFAEQPVVHALLFFSPTCPHCKIVMEHALPPLVEKYDEKLDIVGIDVNEPLGQELYQAAILVLNIPDDRLGIPALFVGNTLLVGSQEIPDELPGIVEKGLAEGGVDWPDIPGLAQILAAQPVSSEAAQTEVKPESDQSTFISRFSNDLLANHIAVIVLLAMIACVVSVGYNFIKSAEANFFNWPKWIVPLLAVAGIGVSAYLTYVETTQSQAICGPVGDCNAVQQSPYARLFGILPIGVFGLFGYSAVLASWVLSEKGPLPWSKYATVAIWGMGWFGIFFSIYLTFLEPFVIGATCAWCITSAIIMTLIFIASTNPAKKALAISENNDVEDIEEEQ